MGMSIDRDCINPPCSVRLEDKNGCLFDSVRPIRLLTFPPDTGQIKGTVYLDNNNNCAMDNMEPPREGIQITMTGQQYTLQTLTDQDGNYSVLAPFDIYDVDAFDLNANVFGCPLSQQITLNDQELVNIANFLIPDSNCYNGRLQLKPLTGRNRLRCDRRRRYIILEVSNVGVDTLKRDTAVITIDSLMQFDRSTNAPYEVIAPQEMWIVTPDLLPGEKKNIKIFFEGDCVNDDEGKEVCFKARYLSSYECNGLLLSTEFCSVILNSRDPNDLTVSPHGVLDLRFIDRNTTLTGLIRFHNTGTDTAYDVSVDLELPMEKVDSSTIELIGSSASTILMSVEEDQIHFDMPDIRLPHDAIDSIGSRGYILYSLKPRADIAEFEIIRQQAHIYFDSNAPIPTNIEYQTIEGPFWTKTSEYVVCEGDTVEGIVINKDTVFNDTTVRIGPDLITEYLVHTLPSYYHEIDTLILAGDKINGVRITIDTTIDLKYKTEEGCDSVVTYHVETTTTSNDDQNDQISLYPNPAGDGRIFIKCERTDLKYIQFISNQGSSVTRSLDKISTNMIDIQDFAPGVYIYRIRSENGIEKSGKLVVR
ncbi:MAG: T9SS type A sorting domain-containing protein [Saprospiraceae bacterium]|nr:T9SS type A sorting domain-containing protein [Saprospiraceae bacterium]